MLRTVIVGSGAVGTLLASRLQASGRHHVTTVCRSSFGKVRQNGFLIRSTLFGDGAFRPDYVARDITDAAQQEEAYDYVFLCTKAFPSEVNSADLLGPLVSARTRIVTVQNGIGAETKLIRAFPGNPVFPAVIYCMSEQTSPGEIVQTGFVKFILGARPPVAQDPVASVEEDPGRFEREQRVAEALAADFQGGGIPTVLTDNIQGHRWLKLVWNASFNPVSVVGGGRNTGEMLADPFSKQLILDLQREIWAIGEKTTGQSLPSIPEFESPEAIVENTAKRVPYKPSMLQDHLNGRPMEHEVILKNPLEVARRYQVPTPRLESVYALMRLITLGDKARA
ncbi:hypothetical protein IWQ60_007041 [Tieghemiomyces parasiticus]|uniref:2-dehydropantoate 2-reductase n=1 Tax=Tieghemiomyces parasiticus TaxID=78921 RepID=A0A9W8A4S0_9FUNG|nr:hypothetical protein IWQ60_007041 [Tieghemiomyces parasiticus]